MPESNMHRDLVRLIYGYVVRVVPEEFSLFVCADVDDHERPASTEEGYIPDVYYNYRNTLVIGEAKTQNDYFTKHSKSQMESYIKKGCCFRGSTTIVIAVPWPLVAQVKNDFQRYRETHGFQGSIVVIDEFNRKHPV